MASQARLWLTRLKDAIFGEPGPTTAVARGAHHDTEGVPTGRGEADRSGRVRTLLPRALSSTGPGLSADTGRMGDFWIMAASRVGAQHQAYGFGREDAYAAALAERQNCAVVAVADGVGSTHRAETIAAVAAGRAAVLTRDEIERSTIGADEFYDRTWDGISQAILSDLTRLLTTSAVENVAAMRPYEAARPDFGGKDMRDPATTLAVAAIWRDQSRFVVRWFAVGDSAIYAVERHAVRMQRLHPDGDPDGTNRTPSLPRDVASVRTGSVEIDDVPGVVLLSDGGEAVLLELGAQLLVEQIDRAERRAAGPAEFAAILDVEIEGEHDDRTCVIVLGGR